VANPLELCAGANDPRRAGRGRGSGRERPRDDRIAYRADDLLLGRALPLDEVTGDELERTHDATRVNVDHRVPDELPELSRIEDEIPLARRAVASHGVEERLGKPRRAHGVPMTIARRGIRSTRAWPRPTY